MLEGLASPESADVTITDITLDSRAVTSGAMFVAVPGLRNHGLQFAAQAIANGAGVIAYEPTDAVQPPSVQGNVLLVPIPNLRGALGMLADRFFDKPSLTTKIVGVTGTNGKTTSAYLIPAALAVLKQSAGYSGTLGYGHIDALQESAHTTADCISVHRQLAAMRDAGDICVGMEVSSHALDQGRIDGVRVHSALFTNLTRDHLDYHGTLEAYGAAKERLFRREGLRHCVVNANDAFGRELIAKLSARADRAAVTAYATKDAYRKLGDRQLFATSVNLEASGVQIAFDGSWGRGQLNSRLIGEFNAENLLGVLAVLLGLDVSLNDAVRSLERCDAPPGRMETHANANKPLVVIDYAHTPDALGKALQTARAHAKRRLVCVFGCGGDRDAGKRPLMGEIAEQLSDVVIVTDDNPRMEDPDAIVTDILQGFSRPAVAIVERDRANAIARAIAISSSSDLVLVAGKGHENYQIIGRNVKHFSDREVVRKCLGLAS
jgi:UDP-N-acetylmuramoyl-L-alanyl-D-glutamate--2,6-diaminopimelate ligase